MFDNLTIDEIIAENVKLKTEVRRIQEVRKSQVDEIRRRNAAAKFAKLSDGEKKALSDMLRSGDVTVTPPPATLTAKRN
jgi:hypothetical protein